jgi:hypothetical protein
MPIVRTTLRLQMLAKASKQLLNQPGLAAERLREAATLLAHQDDNPFRVAAYRRAADAVAALNTDLRDLLEAGGVKTLQAINRRLNDCRSPNNVTARVSLRRAGFTGLTLSLSLPS